MLVLQLVLAAIVAPLGSVLADRMPRAKALVLGYGLQACTNLLLGVCLVAAQAPLSYAAAMVAASVIGLTRPAHNAILPSLSQTLEELTAANAASSTMDGIGTLIGPLAGGVLIGMSGPGGAALAMAVVSAFSAMVALGIHPDEAEERFADEHVSSLVSEALGGLRQARAEPDVATLLGVRGVQFVMVGMLDVFFALLAIDVLGSGEGGAGVLAGGFGFGLLLGGAGAVGLVGARRLAPAVLVALLGSGGALAALSLASTMTAAVAVLAVCGATVGLFAVASRTLLQRRADDVVLARVFGLEEALQMIGLAVGAAAWPRLRRIDTVAVVPGAEFELLRRVSIFTPLPQHVQEQLAWHLTPFRVPAGGVVIREGEPGDRFYVVREGTLAVAKRGAKVAELGPGDFFGEIALLRDVPRTATVTALGHVDLLALERDVFLGAVTGSVPSRRRADDEVERRLADGAE